MGDVFITFVGLPGVGKSTLYRQVVEQLRQRGVPFHGCQPCRRKMPRVTAEVICHPRNTLQSVRAIAATGQPLATELKLMIKNWLHRSNYSRHCARIGGVHVVDAGIFQALWSIGFRAQQEDWHIRFSSLFTKTSIPTLAVVVEASSATVARRLADRLDCHSCPSILERALLEDAQALERAARTLDRVKEILGQISVRCRNFHVLNINNDRDDDFEPNAVRIFDSMSQNHANSF